MERVETRKYESKLVTTNQIWLVLMTSTIFIDNERNDEPFI